MREKVTTEAETRADDPAFSQAVTADGTSGQSIVYYDATKLLPSSINPPSGIFRVERYVAEELTKISDLNLTFIVFDGKIKTYRHLNRIERNLLKDILFCHHRQPRRGLIGKLTAASEMSEHQFAQSLSRDLRRIIPVLPRHSLARRLLTRAFRRSIFDAGRVSHRALSSLVKALPVPSDATANRACVFAPTDVLLTVPDTGDYMDYSYLARIVGQHGVRLISVIHDAIAAELPYATKEAPHVYHRHLVEVGHLAEHLLAVSKHSVDNYRRFIAEPNEVDPAMSYAYLPNFLYKKQGEIGEMMVPRLFGRRFVLYCSTLETRKNHQLLLHLWDRLRQEVSPDKLPNLVFVGSWGWGTEHVRFLSERNWRLRDHLHILNNTSDAELIWLYRHARFTVFPTLSEGFGLPAAESLSFGTPIIIANCPALIEATEGLMPAFDPLDFPSWYAEMRRLALDDDYLSDLRRRAAQFRGARYGEFADAVLNLILHRNDRDKIQCAAA